MKVFFLTSFILVFFTSSHAQVVTTSRLNPIQETPDTSQNSTINSENTVNQTEEVNSGGKNIVITPIPAEATKKEENSVEPVNNSGAKNPR